MKKVISKTLMPAQKAQLKRLLALADADIDTSDIPEQRDWSGARRGLFFRPIKQQLTLRLDADLIGWFKKNGAGYQTRINAALRDHVRRRGGKTPL